jgi:endogenous inhibitor of DNA gyrase (YacG/DUF329 family)
LWKRDGTRVRGVKIGGAARGKLEVDRWIIGGTDAMTTKKKSVKVLRCPTCGMLVRADDEDFPFCSDRCRKIDLGKWAMGVYKISSPVLDPEVLEDLGGLGSGSGRGGGDSYDE